MPQDNCQWYTPETENADVMNKPNSKLYSLNLKHKIEQYNIKEVQQLKHVQIRVATSK